MIEPTEQYIWVVTEAEPTGDRGSDNAPGNPFNSEFPTPGLTTARRHGIPVPVTKLRKGMAEFLDSVGQVIQEAQSKAAEVGNMELDEIELSVEVNGDGQISLLGSGA
ncbi:MAG: hypothetical protein AAFY26_27775, partial [Cyanobacteria bacterium J06638_22]